MFAGAAETTRAAVAGVEVFDHVQFNLQHRDDDQLRQPFHRLHHEFGLAAVPGRDHQLALVVRVDQAHQVPEDDAVLVAQAAARQDHGGVGRVADVYGQAGRYQVSAAGGDGKRLPEGG